jgi:hypothetical protein
MPQGLPAELEFHAGEPVEKNGQWACTFRVMRGERLCSQITTAALWPTREEAQAATVRAVDYLLAYDQWPNFCAAW